MGRDEAIAALQDIPDGEEILIVRGSHPAAPETLREYARRILHMERIAYYSNPRQQRDARAEADRVFAMADRMEQQQGERNLNERIALWDRTVANDAAMKAVQESES